MRTSFIINTFRRATCTTTAHSYLQHFRIYQARRLRVNLENNSEAIARFPTHLASTIILWYCHCTRRDKGLDKIISPTPFVSLNRPTFPAEKVMVCSLVHPSHCYVSFRPSPGLFPGSLGFSNLYIQTNLLIRYPVCQLPSPRLVCSVRIFC